MGLQVPFDLVGAAEALPAHGAAVGLLARVDPHVHLQVGHLSEALPADLATEGLLPCVAALVLLQPSRRAAALPAHTTAIRLLPRVHLHVHMEVSCLAERLAAHFAAKGRHVDLEGGFLVAVHDRVATLVSHVRALASPTPPSTPFGAHQLSAVLHPYDVNVVFVGAVGVDRCKGLRSAVGRGRASVASPALSLHVPGGPGTRVPFPVLHALALGEARRVGGILGVLIAHTGRGEHRLRRAARAMPTKLLLSLAAAVISFVFDLQRKSLLMTHAGTPLTTRMFSILLIQQRHGLAVWRGRGRDVANVIYSARQ